MISISDLFELSEMDPKICPQQKMASILMEAINDWPVAVNSLEEYIKQIKLFIGNDRIDKTSLQAALEKFHPVQYAWQLESLSNLVLLIDCGDLIEIESIVLKLKKFS
jgi:hypothetical protein